MATRLSSAPRPVDATAPVTQVFADVAAAGTSQVAARRDHKHGMPTNPVADISARAFHSVDQSIANDTVTVLAFNSERWDTDTVHDLVTNNSRLTATTAGKYLIFATVAFAANGTGYRELYIRLNGITYIARQTGLAISALTEARIAIATHYNLAAADYVELAALQNSGGSLTMPAQGNHSVEFGMVKLP